MPKVKPSPLYLKLIGRFPLRPLRSDEELEEATEVAEALDFRDDLTSEERDYLDVLIGLIERYEDEHHPIPDVSGLEALKSLIEFRGVSQSEVARGAGIADSVLSEILHGKRQMGLKTIEALAGYFRVKPGLFIPETTERGRRHLEPE
jgi:HTH-type transcriptional regulator/antitoxin HigA